jgi:DNA helicase-2/ATP-dependent DNA helicase PcrA
MVLTEEQQLIVSSVNNNMLLNSAPGSGKSSMLSVLAEKILEDKNNKVLLITFTNQASKSIIGKCSHIDHSLIKGGTFHSLANFFAKENGHRWNICDEGKKRLIIRKLFNCKKDKERLGEIYDRISFNKSEWPMVQDTETLAYNTELEHYGLVDFDDMIYRFIDLCKDETFRLQNFTHLMCDEMQDTSAPQLEMLKSIQKKTNCKMIAACDVDQCIFTFRNARLQNIKDFIDIFKCKVLPMGWNFRCPSKVVEASARLIEHNKSRLYKPLKAHRADKGSIIETRQADIYKEIDYVVSKCLQYPKREIAILYRNRRYKNYLEFALHKAGIKYKVTDILDIADRSAVKVMFSCMKLAAKIGDIYDLDLASKGLRGIGKTTISHLQVELKDYTFNKLIEQKLSFKKTQKRFASLGAIIEWYNLNKEVSLDKLAEFIETHFIESFDYQKDMKEFIKDICKDYKVNHNHIRELCNDLGLDNKEEKQDKDALVTLGTVHSFKGLASDIVILPWVQLYEFQDGQEYDIEEERRLIYVAISRTISILYITYTGNKPRFIKEMGI